MSEKTYEKAEIPCQTGEVTAGFEYDDQAVFNEDSGQPISIDLGISGETARIFIEAKLVEREFGAVLFFQAVVMMEGIPSRRDTTDAIFTRIQAHLPVYQLLLVFQGSAVLAQKGWLFRAPSRREKPSISEGFPGGKRVRLMPVSHGICTSRTCLN